MRGGVRLPLEAIQPYLLEVSLPGAARQRPTPDTAPSGPLHWPSVFGNDRPVEIEVGFGKGLFLLNSGQHRPDVNFVGIEIERKYVMYTANRVAKRELRNVRVVCGDARQILREAVPEASVHVVHVFFPDPWWKNKHRKRKLFTAQFADECARTLVAGGRLHLVTDVEEYFRESVEMVEGQAKLRSIPVPEPSEPRHDLDYLTNFERKYRKEGRAIYRALFEK